MIKLEHINKSFGSLQAVKDANLNVEKGEIICLIGPSAPANRPCCGASTGWRCPRAAPSPSTAPVRVRRQMTGLDDTDDVDFDEEYTIYLTAEGYVLAVDGAASASLDDVYT